MPHDGATETYSPPQGPQDIVNENFPADFRWVRRWIQRTIEGLVANGVSSEDASSVEIVLAEALNNVVEHAYPEDEPGDVRLIVRRRSKSLMIEIADKGRPMPKGRAPIGNHPMSEFCKDDAMPEGGFGWFLIREIVRDLVYDRRDGENILLFRILLETSEPCS